jgi:uroporphyrinogen-III synthase
VPLTALVTRPQPQADAWVQALTARGLQAVAVPLLVISPAPDRAAVRSALQALNSEDTLMFVSPNAAEQFFATRPVDWHWPAGARALATGPGTEAALVAAGVPQAQITAPPADADQFDSETLWTQVEHQDWTERRVTIVRGEGGRDWLASRLGAAGARVVFLQSYRRCAPAATPALLASLNTWRQDPRARWLLSSSEALDHLDVLLPGADWSACTALASHPRIVQRAQALGMGRVLDIRPTVEAVAQGLQHS